MVKHEAPATVRRTWLTNGVAGIGAASLFDDAAHEIPTSLLPGLLTSTLGAPAAALGLIEGIADGLAGMFRLFGGAASDDPDRRRRLAVGGYAATTILSPLIGFATSVWQVGILRAGAWAARGLRSPARNALLADAVAPSFYGRAYGFERAMDNLGAIVGPLLALWLVAVFSVRTAIVLSFLPGLFAVAAIGFAIRHLPAPAGGVRRQRPRLALRPVMRGPSGRLLIAIAAFEFGNIAATLMILRATEGLTPQRGADAATATALWLYLAYNVAATTISVPGGRLSDRIGPVRVLGLGVVAFVISYTSLAITGTRLPVLAAAFVLAGIGIGLAETAEHSAIAASAMAPIRGSAFGVLAAVQSFGNLAASGAAGIIWTLVSPAAAFAYITGWMVLSLVLLGALALRGPSVQICRL
jgi:MFS family permease